jgi:hypothetical protein
MSSRPYLASGAALATAALIAAATPAVLPVGEVAKVTAMAPAPLKISTAQYHLAALTLDELIDAYTNGYGEQVTDDVTVSGISGVLYYVIDTQLATNTDLDNYYFEVSPGYAVEQALYETFGTDSAVGQVVNLIWNPQAVVSSAIIATTLSTFGEDSPIYNAVNYYFNGYEDYSTGVPSVVHYILDTITSAITPATNTSTTATTEAATAEAADATAATTTAAAASSSIATTAVATAVKVAPTTAATATADTTASAADATAAGDATPAAAAPADATATVDTTATATTATATATETKNDNPLVRLSKKFSPTLKSDGPTKPAKAVSDALKKLTSGTASNAASSSSSESSADKATS